MDCSLLDALFVPWWKPVLFIPATALSLALSVVAVRFTISFDLNAWLRKREESRFNAEALKRAEQCMHAWTLYPSSPYSQCASCQAWIPTSILVAARALSDIKPIILAEHPGVVVSHEGPMVVVRSYTGAVRDDKDGL